MSINLRPTFGQVRNILPLKRSAPALCIRTFCSSRSQRDLEQAEIKADAPPPPTSNATIEPGDGYSTQRLANIIRADNKDKSIARPAKRQLKMPVSNHDRTAGTVIGAGKMSKTVKVRFVKQHWNRYLGKYFKVPYNVLVHDENNSIIEGDVVTLRPERYAKHVFHHVNKIVAPFEKPVDQRPPIYTRAEYLRDSSKDKEEKLGRQQARLNEGIVAGKTGSQRLVDDGGGKGPRGKGRTVMPGGKHKFGAINDEASAGKRKLQSIKGKSAAHQEDLEKVQAKPQRDVQKASMGSKPQPRSRSLI